MIMKKILFSSLKVLILMTVVTGFIYPFFITAAGYLLFNDKAEGSMIYSNGKAVGSLLIGQQFNQDKYFESRPSAIGYNSVPSGGSNYGPTSRALLDSVKSRRDIFIIKNKNNGIAPKDLLFSSGSGVDPDISPEAAFTQVERIANARNYSLEMKGRLEDIIKQSIAGRQFGFLGEERINVLMLNMELDRLK